MRVIVSTLNAKYIHTCLALRYLKSYAEPDFSVQIKEYTIKEPALNIATDLYAQNPDVLGFSCYIWNIEQTISVIKILKKVKPALKIVLGGPEVSYDVPYWLERLPEVDFIVVGEGEATFKHLLQELQGNERFHQVLGLAYRDINGKPVINPPRPKLDLNTIPSPFRFDEDLPHLSKRITYVETSRGCPFNCQFCLSSIESGVRYFDLKRMQEEILFLINNGAKLIKFVDRTFNIKRDYAMEMFQFLIKHHQGCVFQFEITADIMPKEVIQFLNDEAPPGIFRFEIGVQSTNDVTNQLVHRRQNFSKLASNVRLIKEGGKIIQHLDLIAGLPEEDYASFRQTFNDVFNLEPEELQLGFLKMLRGTGLRERAAQHGYLYMEQAPYEILQNNHLSFADLIRLKRVEEMLEKYWNAHHMDHTIRYLMRHHFDTPFDFFQQLGDFWDAMGWAKIGHQLEDLFLRLYQFLLKQNVPNVEVVKGLLIYDYLLHHHHKPRTTWWKSELDKVERGRYVRLLADQPESVSPTFEQLHLSEQELYKHTAFEVVHFDLQRYLEREVVLGGQTLLIVYYGQKGQKKQAFFLPLDNARLK